jgi:hypothetical protein
MGAQERALRETRTGRSVVSNGISRLLAGLGVHDQRGTDDQQRNNGHENENL